MAIQSKTKEIDGYTYEVTQFPAREANRIKIQLLKLFGDSLAKLIGGIMSAGKGNKSLFEMDIDSNALANAIQSLTLRIDEDQWDTLVFRLLATTTIRHNTEGGRFGDSRGRELFDSHFAGRMLSMYKLLVFIVEVNYPDFLSLLGTGPRENAPGTGTVPSVN